MQRGSVKGRSGAVNAPWILDLNDQMQQYGFGDRRGKNKVWRAGALVPLTAREKKLATKKGSPSISTDRARKKRKRELFKTSPGSERAQPRRGKGSWCAGMQEPNSAAKVFRRGQLQ